MNTLPGANQITPFFTQNTTKYWAGLFIEGDKEALSAMLQIAIKLLCKKAKENEKTLLENDKTGDERN